MKIFKLLGLTSLLIIFTTGCSINTESPEELINEELIYDESKYEIYKNIIKNDLPPSTLLILPSNSSEVGKINEVDLNNDGIEELVVFEKREKIEEDKNGTTKTKSEVGFMVLSKKDDDKYILEDDWIGYGNSIEYANFYDLDNDGYKEVILLIKEENATNMHIYSFKEDEIKEVYTLNPTWIKGEKKSLDLKIKIEDVNKDNKLEILMAHYDSLTSKLYFSVGHFDEYVKLIDFTQIDNVKSLQNLYITYGVVATEKSADKTIEKEGIILDIPMVKDNSYMTQILYFEDNKLKKAFRDDDLRLSKPYYIPIQDFNNDKVLEIPIVQGSGNVYTSKTDAHVNWYRWNGESDKEDSNIILTSKVYYNYQYNYKIQMPNNLTNINVKQEKLGNDILFKFYYYDIIDVKPKDIFTIGVVNKNILDDKKSGTSSNATLLAENQEYSFILYENDKEELKKLNLNAEILKEYFSLIY
ncbi:MAG: hypothetical protein ACRDD7_05195 [Peptostreptococcaceae bacterium]